MDTIITWVAAFCSLGLLSFTLGENPYYRLIEHSYVGVAAAHSLVMGYENFINNGWTPLMEGQIIKIVPIILGILMYARFIKGQMWLARIPMAVLVGLGTGLSVRGTVTSEVMVQLTATVLPLNSLNNIITVFGVLGVMMFFYFNRRDDNVVFNVAGTFGRYIMMIAFGALFGNAAMGRMSLMIGRLRFLFIDWLGLV